jgi:YVTN family beta-propeller protein
MPDSVRISVALTALVYASAGLPPAAQASPNTSEPYLAIIEKVAGAVCFFTEDGQQLAQVKVGDFPHEAVLSPEGRLYVSDNGVLWMTEDKLGTNTISVLDVHTMKKVDEINLGEFHRPHGIAIIPGKHMLLATTERPAALVMVDPVQKRVVRHYDVKGKSPHMVIPLPDGEWAFVSDTDSSAVAAIDLKTGNTELIPMGERPQGAVLAPSGDRIYVVNTGSNQISVIDTKTRKVVRTIPTGKGPGRVTITPDGKTLVYNLQFEPGVGFADIATGKQVAMIPLSGRPLSLTMTKDGARAFAGIQDQDKVCFISVAGRKIERILQLPKGSGPDPAIPLTNR